MFSHGRGAGVIPQCEVDGSQIPVKNAAKSLGYWWRGDMMALWSVEENIRRARKFFFHYMGVWVLFRVTTAMTVLNLDSVSGAEAWFLEEAAGCGCRGCCCCGDEVTVG